MALTFFYIFCLQIFSKFVKTAIPTALMNILTNDQKCYFDIVGYVDKKTDKK